ncbi:MAG: RNA polymerase sigma factor [Cytophagaceae bacterium]
MLTSNEQEKLVRGCRKKDPASQKELYVRFSKIMFGVCCRYARCRDEAQDILQDAFIKVFTKIDSFSQKGASLEGWIRRIVVTTAIDYYRVKKREMLLISNNNEIEADSSDNIIDALSDKELMESINSLPSGYRIVLNMYAIEGYSHKEIAEILNISEGTSKSQYSRAKKVLGEILTKKNIDKSYLISNGA